MVQEPHFAFGADAPAVVATGVLVGDRTKHMKVIHEFIATKVATITLIAGYSHGFFSLLPNTKREGLSQAPLFA